MLVFGVTPPYQIVQDYRFAAGDPLADPDVRERRLVAVLGFDVADKLFGDPDRAIGRQHPGRRPGDEGEGGDGQEGAGAGPVVRRLRADPDLDLRVASTGGERPPPSR